MEEGHGLVECVLSCHVAEESSSIPSVMTAPSEVMLSYHPLVLRCTPSRVAAYCKIGLVILSEIYLLCHQLLFVIEPHVFTQIGSVWLLSV